MTLEFLEIMEDVNKVKSTTRKRCVKSYKSNTRIYDDGSIAVDPQAQGEPREKDVKKVGRCKRYSTTGKNPLTCIELKCPAEVPDKVVFFQKELAKLTQDIAIEEPTLPVSEFLLNKENLKVQFAAKESRIMVWFTLEAKGLIEIRRELYNLTSEIDKCFVINEASVCQQKS